MKEDIRERGENAVDTENKKGKDEKDKIKKKN